MWFNAIISILTNDKLSDGSQVTSTNTEVKLIDPSTGNPATSPNNLNITGEGEWNFNPTTGQITFAPKEGFTSGAGDRRRVSI